MTSPLVIGPLRAYRCWQLKWQEDQPVMRSVFHPTIWPADAPFQATCQKGVGSPAAWIRSLFSQKARDPAHPAPSWGCQCGVYGFASLTGDELEQAPRTPERDADRSVMALGAVLLWGRVIQHTYGYRAEYARPLKLMRVPTQLHLPSVGDLLDAVAERYGIELVTHVAELV